MLEAAKAPRDGACRDSTDTLLGAAIVPEGYRVPIWHSWVVKPYIKGSTLVAEEKKEVEETAEGFPSPQKEGDKLERVWQQVKPAPPT